MRGRKWEEGMRKGQGREKERRRGGEEERWIG